MTSVPKRRLAALSQQLVEGIPSEGTFENLPRIRHVAGPSTGQRVQGKVAIVTGASHLYSYVFHPCNCTLHSCFPFKVSQQQQHYKKES